eukprot:7997261-Lingulodinium_polyedra.AAC.1
MAVHWEMVCMKSPDKPFAKNYSMDVLSEQVEFLLGEDGWGLMGRDGAGVACAHPTWLSLLRYEYEMRRAVIKS